MNQKMKNDAQGAELKNQFNFTTKEASSQGIQPWKIATLFKLAEKFMNQLANQPTWLVSNYEIEFILEIMLDAVRRAKPMEEE